MSQANDFPFQLGTADVLVYEYAHSSAKCKRSSVPVAKSSIELALLVVGFEEGLVHATDRLPLLRHLTREIVRLQSGRMEQAPHSEDRHKDADEIKTDEAESESSTVRRWLGSHMAAFRDASKQHTFVMQLTTRVLKCKQRIDEMNKEADASRAFPGLLQWFLGRFISALSKWAAVSGHFGKQIPLRRSDSPKNASTTMRMALELDRLIFEEREFIRSERLLMLTEPSRLPLNCLQLSKALFYDAFGYQLEASELIWSLDESRTSLSPLLFHLYSLRRDSHKLATAARNMVANSAEVRVANSGVYHFRLLLALAFALNLSLTLNPKRDACVQMVWKCASNACRSLWTSTPPMPQLCATAPIHFICKHFAEWKALRSQLLADRLAQVLPSVESSVAKAVCLLADKRYAAAGLLLHSLRLQLSDSSESMAEVLYLLSVASRATSDWGQCQFAVRQCLAST